MKVNRLSAENTNAPNYENARRGAARGGGGGWRSSVERRQGKTRWKRGNETGERTEAERTFLHYRHVRGLITGTRGVIFSPSSSRRFAAFFFGPGATSRRLTPLGIRQAVHCHGGRGEWRAGLRGWSNVTKVCEESWGWYIHSLLPEFRTLSIPLA